MTGRIAATALGLLMIVGCEPNPCDDYVDYMCDCHPEEDCASLENTYANADAELQDACAIELEDQEAEDAANDWVCGQEDTGTSEQ